MTSGGDRPVVLTIAGSDNSAGAGLQADSRAITALGAHPLTAVTCVVAEVPGQVSMIQPVRPAVVAEQIRLSFAAFPVGAVKTGMLFSPAIVEATIEALVAAGVGRAGGPALVVDPVMVASSGDLLLKRSAISAYRRKLFPMARLVTPNLHELEVLAGQKIGSREEMETTGAALVEEFGVPFLLKGGHLREREAVDVFVEPGGKTRLFSAPFIPDADPHGTGCTYSAAIAAGLALGHDLATAIENAKRLITRAIERRYRWGSTEILGVERALRD